MNEVNLDTSALVGSKMPEIVVDTFLKTIREKERERILQEIAWRRVENGAPIDSLTFQRMSPAQESAFTSLGIEGIESFPVTDENWASEQVLSGDYALRSSTKDGVSLGFLSFCLTNNGDAIITQVQGKKAQPFTVEKSKALVAVTLEFLKNIGVRRAFLINGTVLNSMRREPIPELNRIYGDIAKDNNFDNAMWSLPYIDLN